MEDVFQIVIWLFIIISFLSSLFRKKKDTPAPPAKRDEKRQREEQQTMQHRGAREPEATEEYDILKEIEGLFNHQSTRSPKPTQYDEYDRVDEVEEAKEAEYKVVRKKDKLGDVKESWKQPASYEQSLENQWDTRRKKMEERKSRIDSSVHRKAEKFEQLLKNNTPPADKSRLEFIRKMKDPNSLKEFIIASEILNKPKALRR